MVLSYASGVRSDSGPEIGALLGDGTCDGGALHLALVVDDHARVVLKVKERAVLSPVCLPLSYDNGRHH